MFVMLLHQAFHGTNVTVAKDYIVDLVWLVIGTHHEVSCSTQ